PGEVLVEGERIAEVGKTVKHSAGAEIIDLGDRTLLPGLIDAHIHLFLHPGAEDLQTVQESVPQRTIMATLAARDDLMAGFTAERDMGTEGAGPADTAVRNAIDRGEIPGPRLRVSGNAINILGGHEDAIGYNPEQHVLPNATYANNADQLVEAMREQFKQGADFIKIYETGADLVRDGRLSTPYQYTEAELSAAVHEAARVGKRVAVHATGEPGALYAAQAGVVSVDHAFQLSDETMRLMREKHIFAVPTFTISEYFAAHAVTPDAAKREQELLDLHAQEFRKQLTAGVPIALGSVGSVMKGGAVDKRQGPRDPAQVERRMPDCLLGITREGPTQANGRAVDTGFPKLNPNELSQTGRARVPLVPFPFSQRLRPYWEQGQL